MMEFVIVLPVVLLLITGIIEFSFLSNAHQVVNYASFTAARSAIVWDDTGVAEEKARLAAAISTIPLSPKGLGISGDIVANGVRIPRGSGKVAIHDVPALSGVEDLEGKLKKYLATVRDAAEKMPFSYLFTDVEITYYKDAGMNTVTTDYEDARVLAAEVTYYYILKFPVVSTLAELASWTAGQGIWGSRRSRPVGETRDVIFHDTDASDEKWEQAQRYSRSGLKFIPIVKRCVMGVSSWDSAYDFFHEKNVPVFPVIPDPVIGG
jgi:hypothetical protein